MKALKIHKKIVIVAIICILLGTISYGANNTANKTNTTKNQANTENVPDKYLGDGLASLKVNELKLSPEFDTTKYEYTVKYIGEDTKLTIETTPTEPYFEVEVTGNKDLKEGENLITILVTDPDGKNVATYQLTVNKDLVDEEAEARKAEEAKKQELKVKAAAGGSATIIVILFIMGIIKLIRKRRNKEEDEKFEENSYFIKEEKEEELPKALRKNNKSKGKRYIE